MASKTHVLVLFFSLWFMNHVSICITSSSHTLALWRGEEVEEDLKKWISWNMQNYKEKKQETASLRAKYVGHFELPRNGFGSFDMRLRLAEMNKTTIVVSQDGSGDFKTIQEALDSIPFHNTRRIIVNIKSGIYREKITIPKTKAFVTLSGDSTDPPTITGNDTASVTGKDGRPLNTLNSASIAVDADYFVAINIRFENTAPHVVGSVGGQAVALRISGTKAAFYNCSFYGTQDTLYDHKGIHYFKNCFIQGSVDFIFGYGRSLYENCVLNSVTTKVASVTAQKRSINSMTSGFSFKSCNITGSGHIYLGRAWGDYSRVIFSYSFMDQIVLPQGWSDWGKRSRDKKVYYGEYKCSGPGANPSGRVPWARLLTDEEALPFTGPQFIDAQSWLMDPIR